MVRGFCNTSASRFEREQMPLGIVRKIATRNSPQGDTFKAIFLPKRSYPSGSAQPPSFALFLLK
jgi:hypothetical protein